MMVHIYIQYIKARYGVILFALNYLSNFVNKGVDPTIKNSEGKTYIELVSEENISKTNSFV